MINGIGKLSIECPLIAALRNLKMSFLQRLAHDLTIFDLRFDLAELRLRNKS